MPIAFVDDVLYLEFGRGDIGVDVAVAHHAASRRSAVSVTFDLLPGPLPIGPVGPAFPPGSRSMARLIFDRVESIQVVLDQLVWARDRMLYGFAPWPAELDRWADDGGPVS